MSVGASRPSQALAWSAASGGTAPVPPEPLGDRRSRPGTPKYIQACASEIEARRAAEPDYHPLERWSLVIWSAGAPGGVQQVPYRCGSWRCRHCRHWRASVDFARIKEAFADAPENEVVFFVLTLDQKGFYSGVPWADSTQAYRQLGRMCSNLMLPRLRRAGYDFGNRWVAVVEAHRTGWPHVNLVIWDKRLAAEVRASQAERREAGLSDDECRWVQGDLADLVTGSGWGRMSSAEIPREGKDAIAGYLVKLCKTLDEDATLDERAEIAKDRVAAEVVKMSQVPTAAPINFRRLRSGRGFLPPKRTSNKRGAIIITRRGGSRRVLGAKPPTSSIGVEFPGMAAAAARGDWYAGLQIRKDIHRERLRRRRYREHLTELRHVLTQTPVAGFDRVDGIQVPSPTTNYVAPELGSYVAGLEAGRLLAVPIHAVPEHLRQSVTLVPAANVMAVLRGEHVDEGHVHVGGTAPAVAFEAHSLTEQTEQRRAPVPCELGPPPRGRVEPDKREPFGPAPPVPTSGLDVLDQAPDET